ncbi:MAG: methyltransferase domain-containing protein [Candidatus Aenigmarchaeota archaeon]|nr:methyltransferase domain-containing protein [Candidatus Aenigmarchaeota archaeon]
MKSFDVIGDIAIVETKEREKEVAMKIMKTNKQINTVYKKASARIGVYRTRKLRLIAGENKSVTTHKENGCIFKLNVRRVYFSPREGTERFRIAKKIVGADLVMVFFAGIGSYPILISKMSDANRIIGIEINPVAVKYFRENVKLNKVNNVEAILGDVKKESKKFYNKCDFVVMPLPESGWKFLPNAMKCLKENGVCFFYAISEEKNLYKDWIEKIQIIAERLNKKVKILECKRVLPFGVRKWKIRIDFMIH